MEELNINNDMHVLMMFSINFLKLNPKTLTGNEEYDGVFFEKIDEI